MYETTVATAERIGTAGPFVDRARASLERMKQLLLAEADVPDEPPPPEPPTKPSSRRRSVARPLAAPPNTAQRSAPGSWRLSKTLHRRSAPPGRSDGPPFTGSRAEPSRLR